MNRRRAPLVFTDARFRGSKWSLKNRSSRQNRVNSRNFVIFLPFLEVSYFLLLSPSRSLGVCSDFLYSKVSVPDHSLLSKVSGSDFSYSKVSVSDYSLLSKASSSDFEKAISASRTVSLPLEDGKSSATSSGKNQIITAGLR